MSYQMAADLQKLWDEDLPTLPDPNDEIARLKGQFLASLNHEIRTPLSGILGMTDLLLETELDEEQQEYVAATRACAQNLLELLNTTLDYTALSAGGVCLEDSEFHLSDVVEAAVAAYVVKAKLKGLTMSCSLPDDFPEIIIGDPLRLRQLISQLLSNAVKFTSEGGVQVIGVAEPLPDDKVNITIEVRDTGIGIAPDHLDNIFESFRQLDNGLSRSYAGVGLGLALAQELARLMGGGIAAESQLGVGSAFRLTFPARLAAQMETPKPDSAPRPRSSYKLLVIEDNYVAQQVVRHVLARGPYGVDCADTGQAGIEAARQTSYDLILMDLQLPGVDGLAATAAIRALPGYAHVPILALTANYSEEYRSLCLKQGMQGFLSKPIQPKTLLNTVQNFLP